MLFGRSAYLKQHENKEVYLAVAAEGMDLIRYREEIARSLGYSDLIVSVDPLENPKMIKLITKHEYEAISEPYIKTAFFYNDDETTYEKTYSRIDLMRSLS
ncbi:MAG: hypothetical protein K6T94_17860 [Paenibacillus sp.]|nr:hypothetical protein [Paenibacillus sp.]